MVYCKSVGTEGGDAIVIGGTRLTAEGIRLPPVDGLENDRIGRLGEIEFARLCELAKVSCSKVEPDRTGKDFIVEFRPPPLALGQSFERRDAPKQFAVQVKTIKAANRSVNLALSVAERLARDLRPALVCIFRIDEGDQFVGLHTVHITDAVLERILARLRKATTDTKPLNQLEMTFTANKANTVDLHPAALLAALSSCVPGTMEDYARHKGDLVQTLGETSIHGTLRFGPTAMENLADGLLGLAPLAGVTVEMLERRFDIDLPIPIPDGEGIVKITPQPPRNAVLTLTDMDTSSSVSLSCGVLLPPLQVFEHGGKKVLITWTMGKLSASLEPGGKCDFSEEFGATDLRPAAEWLQGLRVSEIIMGGNADMVLTLPDGSRVLKGRLNLEAPRRKYASYIRLVELLMELRGLAGSADEPLSLSTLHGQASEITGTAAVLRGGNMTFTLEPVSPFDCADQDGLYVGAIRLGEEQVFGFAFPMACRFEERNGVVQASGTIAENTAIIELLHDPVQDSYARFQERMARITRHRLHIIGELPSPGNAEAPAPKALSREG